MKKILMFTLAISIAATSMAQGKSNGKGHGKKPVKTEKHADKHHDDDDYGKNNGHDDVYRNDDASERRQSSTGKYSKNIPARVRAAFNADYPNASNVTWTKSRGYWTATFPNGIYRRSVTYAANGQRVNNGARSTSRRNTNTQEGSVWDKILRRQ